MSFESPETVVEHSYQGRIRELPLRNWFIITTVIGAGGMLAEYLFGVPLVGLIVSLGAMSSYVWIGQRRRGREIGVQQFADSVYYQGFLFTLLALVSALVQGTLGESFDPIGIASKFGIALVTTLVGLSLRVYLTNFRSTTDDVIERSEEALEEAFRRLQSQLDDVSANLVGQSNALKLTILRTSQVAQEEVQKVIVNMQESLSESIDMTAQVLTSNSKNLEQTTAEITANMQSTLSTALSKLIENLDAAAELMEATVKDLAGRLDALSISEDAFTEKLDPSLSALSSKISEVAETVSDFGALPGTLKDGTIQLTSSVNALQGAMAGTLQRLEGVSPLVSKLSKETGGVKDERARLSAVAASLESEAHSIKDQSALLAESGSDFNDDLAKMVDEEVKRIDKRSREADSALRQFSQQLTEATDFLRESLKSEE